MKADDVCVPCCRGCRINAEAMAKHTSNGGRFVVISSHCRFNTSQVFQAAKQKQAQYSNCSGCWPERAAQPATREHHMDIRA